MNVKITFWPDHKSIWVKPGTTILAAARRARVAIATRCGGQASCLMCKVTVKDQSGLSPLTQKEAVKLGSLCGQDIRLSCQAKVTGATDVELPEDKLKRVVREQLEKQRQQREHLEGSDGI